MTEEVKCKDKLLAIIFRANKSADGIHFFTPSEFSQQLGYMNRPSGYIIQPHIHNEVKREVLYTNEVLFIRNGKVKVTFFDDDQNYFDDRILYSGDVILLAYGGHGFEMLENTEIIEVKQGPYAGEEDKTRFNFIQ